MIGSFLETESIPILFHTQRGRSRAQHVRDREADIERAKKWGPGHLRRSKGDARRAEPTFWMCFHATALKEAIGEARRASDQNAKF